MSDLPTGTPTFLFSDIEGSTRLLQDLGDAYDDVLGAHQELLREAFARHDGHECGTEGDSFFVAFARATDAVRAAVAGQLALAGHAWPSGVTLRVRMGIHTGEARVVRDDYVGLAVHEAARIAGAAHGGQVLASEATRQLVETSLPEDATFIDVGEHRLKDLAKTHRLFQLSHPGLPSSFPPPRSLDPIRNNLPLQLTTFVGREAELEELSLRMSSNRLVTVTGAGGSGKTRIAIQAANKCLEAYPDGVCFVDFAPVTDEALVPQTVATALELRELEGRPIETALTDFLATKRMLLILDNCEHLVRPCSEVATAVLEKSRDVSVVATTREALGVAGESTWRVPSLGVPDPVESTPEALQASEAVRLFLDRASLVDADLEHATDDLRAIAHICRRLDGIPLAIELAAARTDVLTPRQIAERVDDRFRLLTGGGRRALARQQTLRALVDWSYDLLDERERTMLNRVSVFVGGFTLHAAEAVCADDEITQTDVIELLSDLARKSLIIVDRSRREARFSLLETIRHYGHEHLITSVEASDIRERHCAYFAELAERTEPELQGADQAERLRELELEHDNIRAALDWLMDDDDSEAALRLASSLWHFWWVRGHWSEGRSWLDRALARAPDARAQLRCKAMWASGFLATFMVDYDAARPLLNGAIELARALGDAQLLARPLWTVGFCASRQDDFEAATLFYGESLENARRVGDKQVTIWCLLSLGSIDLYTERAESALARWEEALAIARGAHDLWNIAMALNNIANQAHHANDLARSAALFDEAHAIRVELDDKHGLAQVYLNLATLKQSMGDRDAALSHLAKAAEYQQYLGGPAVGGWIGNTRAWLYHLAGEDETALPIAEEAVASFRDEAPQVGAPALHTLAEIVRALGDTDRAAALYRECLALPEGYTSGPAQTGCLHGLAAVAATEGHHERAATLYGAVEALREQTGEHLSEDERRVEENDIADLRRSMDEQAFSTAWTTGRTLDAHSALQLATGLP